jgi:PhnB protein
MEKMTNATNRTINDRQTVRLFLCIKEAAKAIEFYKKAFGAEELTRSAESDGRIGRAEVRIGNSRLLIADEYPEAPEMKGVRSPQSLGGSSMHICLEVEDVDSCFNQAVAAGAKPLMPIKGKSQGGRRARLTDPFGHIWTLSSGPD